MALPTCGRTAPAGAKRLEDSSRRSSPGALHDEPLSGATTPEVFVFRVAEAEKIWDPFYLLWALSLSAVRDQWRRIALMQTNREDCGDRYREVILPRPPSRKWAKKASAAFADYFSSIAAAREAFVGKVSTDDLEYVANVRAVAIVDAVNATGEPTT